MSSEPPQAGPDGWWFDAVATRYGCRVQGTTEAVLTVLDVLGYLDEIPICVGYEIDGKITKDFPTTPDLERAKPVYKTLPGWKCEDGALRNTRAAGKLPEICGDHRRGAGRSGDHGIQRTGKGRHHLQKVSGAPHIARGQKRVSENSKKTERKRRCRRPGKRV